MTDLFIPDQPFHDDFLSGASGHIAMASQARYCEIRFDRTRYHDALYRQYAIDYPQNIRQAVVKRKAEYLAARYGCALLLREAGAPHTRVASGANRQPLWPPGFCGAITHSKDRALVVIAPLSAGLYPGVDIEFCAPQTLETIAQEITTPQELRYLKQGPGGPEMALLLAFSAKESLFKSLWPQVGRFLNFTSASVVAIAPQRREFTLQLNEALSAALPAGRCFYGHYRQDDSAITTLIL
ncbi:4'-phosphopantetheinyl transferase family protein [Entomohabitans teleogrylli]|uniref:4'-phosphopantetheinyl transferase family protein n=1 Tax=Entomohabitans teleogrylli TaxID=1384589 RepID=UPI00073D1AEB|nr:4'-phosphopantetheinyl transferase superfamily protein [Entomohabitans teleogrylli]